MKLKPFLAGGTGSNSLMLSMPETVIGLEPSSPNIVAISGLYAALQFIKMETIETIYQKKKHLTEELIKGLMNIPGVKMYLPQDSEKHIGIVSFSVVDYRADEVGMILDEDYKIAVRSGYHCAPLIHGYLNSEEYGGTIRVGLSYFSKQEDVERLLEAVKSIALEG